MTDSVVVAVEFGKEQREAARRFARLLDLVETQDREILANPKKYLDMASEQIIKLQRLIEDAQEALYDRSLLYATTSPQDCPRLEAIYVDKAEWDRLRAAAEIIRRG